MSERDSRTEAASIVRSLRRVLERAAAASHGELLWASARVAAERPAAPSGPARSRPAATGTHVPLDPNALPVPAAAPDVDLFGVPTRRAADPEPVPDLPSLPTIVPSHPGGVARAGIAREASGVLEVVGAEVRGCTKCGLCETRIKAVPGVGSAESGIVFVGEAPGAEEDARGEPFVGRAGQLLTRIIQAMDDARLIPGVALSRETVYICNVLKCRPPENRNPLPHEIETCSPYLTRQLEALRPRIICCLGKFAAELLVGAKGTIGGMRGKVYRYRGAKLIVTYHPAACLRNPAYKRPVWEDMQLLAREYLDQGPQ